MWNASVLQNCHRRNLSHCENISFKRCVLFCLHINNFEPPDITVVVVGDWHYYSLIEDETPSQHLMIDRGSTYQCQGSNWVIPGIKPTPYRLGMFVKTNTLRKLSPKRVSTVRLS